MEGRRERAPSCSSGAEELIDLTGDVVLIDRYELARSYTSTAANLTQTCDVALRGLWRELIRRRAEDKALDLRPARDKLPALDHFVRPPKPTGLDKPKY